MNASAARSVFYGFGAYVGQLTGATTCNFWADDPSTGAPAFDPTKFIPVDLARNPQACRDGKIAAGDIQCDDAPANGGMTKIGPSWPAGSWINSCWLESDYYSKLKNKPSRKHATDECYDYELTTVIYWDGPLKGRRFWGHHVEIQSESGTSALVSIYPAGRSQVRGQKPNRSIWMDLAAQAMPIEANFTQVGVGGAAKTGALFIEQPTLHLIAADITKKPIVWGGSHFPRMPRP
ncbi:MAG: hypothetical protein ABI867_02535 [Kofleriaceae bacterium]